MEKLSIELKNCFGISDFNETFSFEKSNAHLIYAPNGVMKTSLAKTFDCLSVDGGKPKEVLYNLEPEWSIKIDDQEILPDEILVVKPFDAEFDSDNLSTLLVNSEQKATYDSIYKEILSARNQLSKGLNKLSKVPQDKVEQQLIDDFEVDNIFEAIEAVQNFDQGNSELSKIPYSKIFDPKVIELLNDESIRDNIDEYSTRYNELVDKSPLFSRGKFNPINAASVSKSLKKEKFFNAEHKLLMKGNDEPICDQKSLDELLKKESESILGDGQLQTISNKIISGVAPVKAFQEIIESSPSVTAYLGDLAHLKKLLWSSYYATDKSGFDSLLSLFQSKKSELAEIERQASLENTLWHESKEVFKRRFYVPFGVDIEDHKNVILGTSAPNMVFTFPRENGEPVRFDRGQLDSLDCLSLGERRAMYLLYVIFEFKARLKSGQRSVIIIDDIADSFDYKNKYAIVEYLREMAGEDLFRLIILTHNFDFYRTVQGRVLDTAQWDNSFIAQKSEGKILLLKGGSKDVSSPFDLWKKSYDSNAEMFISMIPFVRNLIEYRDGFSPDYKKLTSMLHIKDNDDEPDYKTRSLKVEDLENIIAKVVQGRDVGQNFDKDEPVLDLIYRTADDLANAPIPTDTIALERKIALSIAIRLKAEEFMWNHVNDKTPIKGSQTGRLFNRIVNEQSGNGDFEQVERVLSQVTLMTPENIHLNSFMYEPLIDLAMDHLITLFRDIKALTFPGA
ncbi:phage infection protein [Idiomarina tyrosinivorans]|uniref:Phage infection protein n=2 Tax=Gammaproteobacteria TaxID=1236 RepID=A0A432ZSU1_9GAMM|nr:MULTISPECIES: AAA family ATPase [Gammaproteobacteria]ONF44505.1 phage infection protein [Marinobacter lutaoensis]RUO80994.1 phage infection protein [Idiomarina tyrosinivorans]